MRATVLALMTAAAGLLIAGCGGKTQPDQATVSINGATWRVEVASDPQTRAKGLSGRRELPEGTGMLFVFDKPDEQVFWMRGCYIPLDIAFIAADGRVLNTETMFVEADMDHPVRDYSSAGKALYALEAPAGSLARAGVRPGQMATIQGIAR